MKMIDAISAGYAVYQAIVPLTQNGKPCGYKPHGWWDHNQYGSAWIVTGPIYKTHDGRIGLAD